MLSVNGTKVLFLNEVPHLETFACPRPPHFSYQRETKGLPANWLASTESKGVSGGKAAEKRKRTPKTRSGTGIQKGTTVQRGSADDALPMISLVLVTTIVIEQGFHPNSGISSKRELTKTKEGCTWPPSSKFHSNTFWRESGNRRVHFHRILTLTGSTGRRHDIIESCSAR